MNHVFPLSSIPLSPFPRHCLMSYISCLKCLFLVSHPLFPVSLRCSLFPVHCSLSHVCVPCLPSSVPCLTSLCLVSRPLSPVLCSMSHFSGPCLPSSVPCLTSLFRDSRPLSPILCSVSLLCSLSPVLCSMSHFFVPCLPPSVPNLTSMFLVSRSLPQILSLCSLYPVLLSRQFVALYWFRVCSACDEIVSAYAQHAFGCQWKNCQNLNAGWAYAKICSAYAQCVMKLFPCMHNVR